MATNLPLLQNSVKNPVFLYSTRVKDTKMSNFGKRSFVNLYLPNMFVCSWYYRDYFSFSTSRGSPS